MSKILFKNKSLTIIFYEEKNYLFLKWTGFIPSEDFKTFANQILIAIAQTKTQAILSDNTNWNVINPNDHAWAANHWFPDAEKKGVRKLATILSQDYLNRAAEKNIEGMAEVNCMQIQNFNTYEESIRWLRTEETLSSFCN